MYDAPTRPVNRIEAIPHSALPIPHSPPRWQKIMTIDSAPHARIAALRRLARAAENMLKHELRRRDKLGVDEVHFCWDPVRQICHTLEIAPHKLSTLLREFNGLAAHELVDYLRAKKIKAKLRADLRTWFLKTFGLPGERPQTERRDNLFALAWSRLKKSRSSNPFYEPDLDRQFSDAMLRPKAFPSPLGGEGRRERSERGVRGGAPLESDVPIQKFSARRSLLTANAELPTRTWSNPRKNLHLESEETLFDKTSWALSHGFANHARFHKACLLEHRQTPRQLEYNLLREFCDYYAAAESLRRRNIAIKHGAADGGPNSLLAAELYGEDIDPKPEKPYRDLWSLYRFLKLEWLKTMYADFGLSASLTDDEESAK